MPLLTIESGDNSIEVEGTEWSEIASYSRGSLGGEYCRWTQKVLRHDDGRVIVYIDAKMHSGQQRRVGTELPADSPDVEAVIHSIARSLALNIWTADRCVEQYQKAVRL